MKDATKRSIFRWIYLVFSTLIPTICIARSNSVILTGADHRERDNPRSGGTWSSLGRNLAELRLISGEAKLGPAIGVLYEKSRPRFWF